MASLASLETSSFLQRSSPHHPPDSSPLPFRLALSPPPPPLHQQLPSLSSSFNSPTPGSPRPSPTRSPLPNLLLLHAKAAAAAEVGSESDAGLSYQTLRDLLASGQWQLADEETRRLLLVLAGESAVKRGYVFFSEVQFIPEADLRTIDGLWRVHSNDKFGYSVQRKIWKRSDRDFTTFFKKVGWMRPLGSDSLQYTYRSFPSEFFWELESTTPEGHLPLTNALRGTRLLSSILTHPAFDFSDEDLMAPKSSSEIFGGGGEKGTQQQESKLPKQQKPAEPLSVNYSF